MPEVAETALTQVAHVVALLRRNVLGCKISSVILKNDPLLFPGLKAAVDADKEVESMKNTLLGSQIDSVGRHGKYFWMRLNLANGPDLAKAPSGVLLMHFGMTGMIKLRNVDSHLTFMENGGDKKVLEKLKVKQETTETVTAPKDDEATKDDVKDEEWPPKFVKFEMELQRENGEVIELAFVDPRRLGRVRVLTGETVQSDESLMQESPLKTLGPDYSKSAEGKTTDKFVYGDPDPHHHGRPRLSVQEFNDLVLSKKKPVKSMLLEQELFSGVGNWVADEVIYHARLHPNEIISSKISNDGNVNQVIENLYNALVYVCEYCVSVEGEVTRFPDNWLMPYRWGKGRKQGKSKTREGYEVDHVTVGGRTSCFVPELQKMLKSQKDKDTQEEKEPRATKRRAGGAAGGSRKKKSQ
ncbi:Formamidopyrimidine-DNA glycosylase [Meyerozyma sp. JA9]|nr:Formamidopyrimidine-DNA glycosylase [Meyerozyma sp. JA9]